MSNILGLDIGEKRVGVARVNKIAKLPEPLVTLPNDENFTEELSKIVKEYDVEYLVVGLPRNLSGQKTKQTLLIEQFTKNKLSDYKIVWQDETLSTVKATENSTNKAGIDAEAAAIILEDYIKETDEI
jgi:putative Holliday junction resolvase